MQRNNIKPLKDMFDQRLAAKVIRTVDVSYGGENGFNQAIELVQDDLSNVKFVQEKKLICELDVWFLKFITCFSGQYFDEISRDTGKYCFAIGDTVSALEQGAVETLIIWENLDIKRYVFRNPVSECKLFAFESSLLKPILKRTR